MEWLRIRWERDARYYEVHLHQDLWGQWVLTRVWGRRGTQLGRVSDMLCGSYEQGLAELVKTGARRERRGYIVL